MRRITLILLAIIIATIGIAYYNRVEVSASLTIVGLKVGLNDRHYDIPTATTYGWINGIPVVSEELNFAWVNGKPYGIFMATTSVVTYSVTSTPDKTFANPLAPSTSYYAYGAAPANPVDDANCTFTITNDGSGAEKIQISSTDFTNYALGTPDATHVRMTWYTTGDNPSLGIVVNGTAQTLIASLPIGTRMADFKLDTITANGNGAGQTATVTFTAVAP